jgi:exodeoxyribonuclease VII large subunit
MTLFDPRPDPEPAIPNLAPYTVSELSGAVKRTVEGAFGLVRVRGEIAQPKRHVSGHLYFCLKDDKAVLDGVSWKSARLSIEPEHGMDVICTGKLTTYPGRSKYQLIVETIELAGEGAILKLLEDRRKKLLAEGLFEASRKRPLPHIPEVIGVITSPTGAVIHDILHRLADRFPRRVLVWPVAVQGPGAAEQIAAAIAGFNSLPNASVPRPDLLIVARGGGSLEDLMPFNEENVVRAAAASAIPIISAVGHETDHTLIDLVSDRRAPTPTAAAEFAVPVRAELLLRLGQAAQQLTQCLYRHRERQRAALEGLARLLSDPRRLLESAAQSLDDRAERLAHALTGRLQAQALHLARAGASLKHPQAQLNEARQRLTFLGERASRAFLTAREHAAHRLEALSRHLDAVSYRNTLARGFAVVRGADGHAVSEARRLKPGQSVTIEFADGNAGVKIV